MKGARNRSKSAPSLCLPLPLPSCPKTLSGADTSLAPRCDTGKFLAPVKF